MTTFYEAIEGMTEVGEVAFYDYRWSAVCVWKDNAQFYWAYDAGCSCNSFGELLTGNDLIVLDSLMSPAFRDALDRATETDDKRIEFVSTLRRAGVPG